MTNNKQLMESLPELPSLVRDKSEQFLNAAGVAFTKVRDMRLKFSGDANSNIDIFDIFIDHLVSQKKLSFSLLLLNSINIRYQSIWFNFCIYSLSGNTKIVY